MVAVALGALAGAVVPGFVGCAGHGRRPSLPPSAGDHRNGTPGQSGCAPERPGAGSDDPELYISVTTGVNPGIREHLPNLSADHLDAGCYGSNLP